MLYLSMVGRMGVDRGLYFFKKIGFFVKPNIWDLSFFFQKMQMHFFLLKSEYFSEKSPFLTKTLSFCETLREVW